MLDVFGLGNAIVDTEVDVDDTFLQSQALAKGHMTLVDSERVQALLAALDGQPLRRSSGGSAANTIYAVQAFGFATAYACKVSNDAPGQFFLKDMSAAGVALNGSVDQGDMHSGQCLVMITPDAERTMTTDLGISSHLAISDVDLQQLAGARYFYVEGYLSSSPVSSAAAVACREAASAADTISAVSLSDPSMVSFFRDPLTDILGDGVGVIFCNEEEALAWANTDRLDIAAAELKDIAPEVYVTLGAAGSIAVVNGHIKEAAPVSAHPVDTNGAGDMYAGAVLAARCGSAEPVEAARFGNHCAAELVQHHGARLAPADYHTLRNTFS